VKATTDLGGGEAAAVQMEKGNAPSPPSPALRSECSATPILSASPLLESGARAEFDNLYKIRSLRGR
jgi:hypothetical protein